MGQHIPPVDVGEGHITILPWNYSAIGQGTWVLVAIAAQWAAFSWYNSSNANGDNISYKVFLQAGTYTLRFLCLTHTNDGIVDIDIDGTEVASFDLYTAGLVYNAVKSQTGITIATSGLYDLTIRVDGKNASSVGYWARISCIALWRTA